MLTRTKTEQLEDSIESLIESHKDFRKSVLEALSENKNIHNSFFNQDFWNVSLQVFEHLGHVLCALRKSMHFEDVSRMIDKEEKKETQKDIKDERLKDVAKTKK